MNDIANKVRSVAIGNATPLPTTKTLRNQRRRQRRKMRNGANIEPFRVPNQVGTTQGKRLYSDVVAGRRFPELSTAGEAFLRCAYADPDFSMTGFQGIPDGSKVRSVKRKHRATSSINLVAGNDYYILVAPVPGVAYFLYATSAGLPVVPSSVFGGNGFSDTVALFATGAAANVVNQFRIASLGFKAKTNINEMTWSGNVRVWKFPVRLVTQTGATGGFNINWTTTGLQGANSTQADMYTNSVKEGMSSFSTRSTETFRWIPIIENQTQIPQAINTGDFGALRAPAGCDVPGMAEMDSILIKLDGITTNETFTFESWQCVEYAAVNDSILYPDSSCSPPIDELALKYYEILSEQLPIAVPFDENDGLWRRILEILHGASGALSVLPGGYGAVARGVNLVTGGIKTLVV